MNTFIYPNNYELKEVFMEERTSTKIGGFLVVALVLFGVGMFFFQNYSGAAVSSTGKDCQDTDNSVGLDNTDSIFIKGSLKIKSDPKVKPSGIPDVCGYGSTSTELTEYYCAVDDRMVSKKISCTHGCLNGQCKTPTCSDSDGPTAYSIKGNVNGIKLNDPSFIGVPPAQQAAKNYEDICVDKDGNPAASGATTSFLKEYSCEGNAPYMRVKENLYDCSKQVSSYGGVTACADGRCKAPCFDSENCFNFYDDDCDGIVNDGCFPYTCVDNDPTNDPAKLGVVRYNAANGEVSSYESSTVASVDWSPQITIVYADTCVSANAIVERYCPPGATNFDNPPVLQITKSCPAGTTCKDTDGVFGKNPAQCV